MLKRNLGVHREALGIELHSGEDTRPGNASGGSSQDCGGLLGWLQELRRAWGGWGGVGWVSKGCCPVEKTSPELNKLEVACVCCLLILCSFSSWLGKSLDVAKFLRS